MKSKEIVKLAIVLIWLCSSSCKYWHTWDYESNDSARLVSTDTLPAKADTPAKDSAIMIIDTVKTDSVLVPAAQVHTRNIHPAQVVEFAKTLIGVPYRYASTDPHVGFDC